MLGTVLGPVAASADPQVRCALDDPRLAETSGLVVGPEGPQVVEDSGNPSTVYRLDGRCAVAGRRAVPVDGRDVEDLARSPDGTLWLADTGDNARRRPWVAVLRLDRGGGEVVTRFAYPDGPHDAESLLMPGDDRPVIVTKDRSGRSGVYVPDEPVGEQPALTPRPLRRAGEVVVPGEAMTGLGAGAYTGGAISADGRVVALRTYTDAWLYPAPRGTATADDVVAALHAAPVRVPLPGEPQGEAVAFALDGTLLATGETPAGQPPAALDAVPGAAALVGASPTTTPPPGPPAPSAASAAPAGSGGSGPLLAVGTVLAVAVLVVLALVLLRGRRRRR